MKSGARGNAGRIFSGTELLANLQALERWNKSEFAVHDVLHFADYIAAGLDFLDPLLQEQNHLWGNALPFSYPKNPKKLRYFTILGPADLVLLRAAGGRIARAVEPKLSSRAVGYRTEWIGEAWRFNNYGVAWKAYTDEAVQLLRNGSVSAMCATDVAGYYPLNPA